MGYPLAELWFQRDTSDGSDRAAWEHVATRGRVSHHDASSAARVSVSADDTELVARVRSGDEAVFDALFRETFPKLTTFATILLHSPALAEEVVAEVFLRIWRTHATWAPQGPVRAYLFRAVRNQASNIRRGERRADIFAHGIHHTAEREALSGHPVVPGMAEPQAPPDHVLERREIETALWRAIDHLPPQRKAVAYLRWKEGMGYEDIASITGQSAEAVKKQINRVVNVLRTMLGGSFG